MHWIVSSDGAWRCGWALVLLGFASGAVLGLRFEREDFLGGYGSVRRRLVRLGHIACVALGVLQMLYALSPAAALTGGLATTCAVFWRVGSFAMPLACWLCAWKLRWKPVFAVPVVCLVTAASLTLALLSKGAS